MAHVQPARRRLRVLLLVLVVLACSAGGYWVYEGWPPNLPNVPTIDLADADPEVAEVVAAARSAVVKEPRSLEAWARLAMLLHAHKFVDEAVVCYTAAESLDHHNPFWPYLQGTLLQNGANPETALPCFERAAKRATRNVFMPRVRLADLLLDLGRLDDAEREYRKVLVDQPGNIPAQFGLAQVAVAREDYAAALRHLQAVADDAYTRKRAGSLIAAAYERLGQHENAQTERRQLATLPADQPMPDILDQINELQVGLTGRLRRARSLGLQSPTEAITLLEETVRRYPKSDQAWVTLAVARENVRDFKSAEEAFQKCIELAPERADHRFTFGEFLQGQRRFPEAANAYRQAIERRPVDADAYFKLGECLQAQGNRTGAADAFHHAIRLRPDMTDARLRLEKLDAK